MFKTAEQVYEAYEIALEKLAISTGAITSAIAKRVEGGASGAAMRAWGKNPVAPHIMGGVGDARAASSAQVSRIANELKARSFRGGGQAAMDAAGKVQGAATAGGLRGDLSVGTIHTRLSR
mgnify:CR=1 FL=1